MLIVDTALDRREEANRPVRVGVVGAGFMGRACARQVALGIHGMELVAICNRTVDRAIDVWAAIGRDDLAEAGTRDAFETLARARRPIVTDDHTLLCQSDEIDVVLELTGAVGFGARIALDAIAGGKHFVSLNAELDGTVGPILRHKANRAGVIYTIADGDQPGSELNLYRYAIAMGFTPLVCGSMKGMLDLYRTPETQADFAAKTGVSPYLATSAADGTKVSFEQAIVANATGMCVGQRGMYGFEHHGLIDGLTEAYDVDRLKALGGVVDYALGALPSPGVYIFATHEDPVQRPYLDYAKLGKGPLYSLYLPFHLLHLEVPLSIARAALFGDTVVATDGPIRVEVVAVAKRDLKADETLDGIGGFTTYGTCENAWAAAAENLLPIGLAEGCVLRRNVARDAPLTFDDVTGLADKLLATLRSEQARLFPTPSARTSGT